MLCSVNTRIHTTLYPAVFTRNFRTPFKSTYIRNSRPFHVHMYQKFQTFLRLLTCIRNFQTLFMSTFIRNSRPFSRLHVSEIPQPFHIHMYQKFQTLFTCISEKLHSISGGKVIAVMPAKNN